MMYVCLHLPLLNGICSTNAGARPLNSALEVDLDFERAVRPPPQPTEEVTASLEDLIRARIAEHNFDDVPRVAPPAPEKKTKTIDLDDKKSGKVGRVMLQMSCFCTDDPFDQDCAAPLLLNAPLDAYDGPGSLDVSLRNTLLGVDQTHLLCQPFLLSMTSVIMQGLGEIYEEEYVRAAAGGAATQDRDEKVRAEARSLVKALFAKLDALSHFHFAPKPVIEDLSVRADVPALAMEEVAPQVRACPMIHGVAVAQVASDSTMRCKRWSPLMCEALSKFRFIVFLQTLPASAALCHIW